MGIRKRLETEEENKVRKVSEMAGKQKKSDKIKAMPGKIKEKLGTIGSKVPGRKGKSGTENLPVIKMGPRKKWIITFWVLLGVSIVMGIYNNFTAVDTETVIEKEIVEEKLKDTNGLESFVKAFARLYHSWQNLSGDISKREQDIGGYMTEELTKVNKGTVTTDCPTAAIVKSVNIWSVDEMTENDYDVCYSVLQEVTENEQTREEENAYETTVHIDNSGKMVITRNPTACALPKKSSYEPKEREMDGSVGSIERNEIEEFLNTFFSLYPEATDRELAYYVKDGVLQAIEKNYVYAGLENAVYYAEDNQTKADVYVKYLDQDAKIIQKFQYTLLLEKGDNWRIVGVE